MGQLLNAVRDCACIVWSPPITQDESTPQRLYYFLKPEGLLRLVSIIVCVLIIFLCIPLYEQPTLIAFLIYDQIFCGIMASYHLVAMLLRITGLLLRDLLYFKADFVLQIVFATFNTANLIVWLVYSVNLAHAYKQSTVSGVSPSGSRYDEISLTNLCFTAILILSSVYIGVLNIYVFIKKPLLLQEESNH
eukprot:TRINITY_DN29189_c0_g1_i1.p1 TRINITY_DN29189_c0_g1~~TRINITY_DN29189_c0_g1_i1.p1  ORF type:complete len:191 (+),score=22.10 TRINITY_DN29189_c0_g1_i1:47-619(+)